ncbi:heat-inducible transcriptional repressor HrcA [Micrococcoides hystricis]|uniref:Heat-inducible transcription repressor HrcA n=1 Tax=Micrococcoides hystricis TaxID=1572761 RepID=A0ABV6P7E6_9MICC
MSDPDRPAARGAEPRKLQVLRAIVEDYVHSREPVGSKALVERHNLGVSSATVRNDMASLEEEGLIVAPHTSAGRIPTDKGYRLFVDQIAELKPLSAAERNAIHTLLESSGDLDEMLSRTVRLLSQLTNQVAVLQIPSTDAATLRHLEFVALAATKHLVVVIDSAGKVEQRVITTADAVSDEDLQVIKAILLDHLAGQPMALLPSAEIPFELLLPAHQLNTASILLETVAAVADARATERIVMAGTANLARSNSDFPYSIGPILQALEEQVVLLRLLSEMEQDASGLSVKIGRENPYGSLAETSLVVANYGTADTHAKLGVMGPTRMDYPGTMAAVRAIAKYLSKILAQR